METAYVHCVPMGINQVRNREVGMVAFTSGVTGLRSELHGHYIYHRYFGYGPDIFDIWFKYCGEINGEEVIPHRLTATSPTSSTSYRDIQRWVTAEIVQWTDVKDIMLCSDRKLWEQQISRRWKAITRGLIERQR